MPSAGESLIEALRPTLLGLLRAVPGEPAAFSTALEPVARRNDAGVWKGLVACASQHGVLGVIDRPLTAEALPADVREDTERRLVVDQLWQEHMVNGLLEAVGTLANAGVKTCAMKGPVLAARLYPPGEADSIRAGLEEAGGFLPFVFGTDRSAPRTEQMRTTMRRYARYLARSHQADKPAG